MESIQENRKLGNMRKNLNKKKKREEKNKKIPFKGSYLFSELIKKQKLAILSEIAKDKLRSKEEREDFIQKFLKITTQKKYECIQKKNINKNLQDFLTDYNFIFL